MYTYRAYLVHRLAGGVLVAFAVSGIIFLLMRVAPHNPQETIVSQSEVGHQKIMQDVRHHDSLSLHYLQWIKALASGHLGKTFLRQDNIVDLIWRRGPLSAEIIILAVLLSWLVGLPVGIISALYPASAIDIRARKMSELCLAIPGFWLAILIVLGLRLWFHQIAPLTVVQIWESPWENLQLVSGPVVVLGLGHAASIVRLSRLSLSEMLCENDIRTANAKGRRECLVMVRPALAHTLLTVFMQSSSLLGGVLGGAVLIEQIFGVPGLGRTIVMAVIEGEHRMALHLVLLYVLILVVMNLLMDLSTAWFDPSRYSRTRTSDACTASRLPARAAAERQFHLALRRLIKRFARRYPVSAFWGCVAIMLLVVAIAAPWISPQDPLQPNFQRMAKPPDAQSYLGTDQLGRDTLSRVIHGGYHSLTVAIAAVFLGMTTGALWGCASGSMNKRFDQMYQYLMMVLQSFPALILALAMATVWGTGTGIVVAAIAITCIPSGSQGVRAVSLSIKERFDSKAARTSGISLLHIRFRHIVPQYMVPYLALATARLRAAIILAASLDFLGLGTPLPTPTWGNLLADALTSPMSPWWLVLFPGLAMIITLLAFNLFGDGIHDALHHGVTYRLGGILPRSRPIRHCDLQK